VAFHLLFSVLFAVFVIALDSAILPHLRIFPSFMKTSGSTFALLMVLSFHQNVLSYWTILGIQSAFRYYHAYQERERQALRLELHASELKAQLTRAQLGALKMQLQGALWSSAVTAISGAVFSGSVDGHLRAYSTASGEVLWDVDTGREYETVNGQKARGGSLDGPGPVIAGGMLYVNSGYGQWGGMPGNVLLAFSIDGK
jgi:outer membrane protein assembly factor BamB